MTEEEKKALDSLQSLIENKAKDNTVYKKAENVIKKHPLLTATVGSIVKGKLESTIKLDDSKSIGFSIDPKEEKASIGFKMSFQDGGFINKYAPGDVVTSALDTLTFEKVMDSRIEVLQNKYNTGAISKTALDQAKRTKVRLFGGTHNNIKYTGVLKNVFPDINPKELLFNQVNSEDGIKNILKYAGENEAWFKGKPGAATDFWKSIQGAIGNTVGKSGYNAASAVGKDNPLVLQGMKLGRGPVFESETYRSVAQQLKTIKDPNSRRLAKIMLLTGIRETDLVNLKASDIDFVNNTITTFSGKGAGAQVIPISDSVKTLLQQQTNTNPTGATIFSKPKIKASNLASHYSKNINSALNKIEILDTVKNSNRAMTLEDLRRAFSMRASALGIPSDTVDSLMGHTVKGTKAIYQKGTTSTALKSQAVMDAINILDKDLFIQLGFETPQDAVSFTEGKFKVRGIAGTTIGQQVDEIIPQKTTAQPVVTTKTVTSQVEPKVTIVEEPELTKSQTSVSGNKYTELPPPDKEKIQLSVDKSGKGSRLKSILSFVGKKIPSILPFVVGGGATILPKIGEAAVDVTLTAGTTGFTIDQQINQIMQENDMTKGEAIEYYKQNPPVETPEGVYGIGPYEEKFKKQQIKKEQIAQEDANFAEIMQKGLMKADLVYPNE